MSKKLQPIGWLIAAAFLVAGGAPAAYAQQSGAVAAQHKAPANNSAANQLNAPAKIPQKPLSLTDKAFVDSAARDGMLEIALAKQAEAKSSSPDVKNFARKIIEDHTKADRQLKQIAREGGFKLPDTLSSAGQKELQKFSRLTGSKFDKAYIKFAVKDHRKATATFASEANQGTDPSLKTFASNTLPTLRQHLSMAESVNGRLAKGASTNHPWWEFWKRG